MATIETHVRLEMKKNHKRFDNVNFVQDGKMRYQWGQFYKFACKIEFESIEQLNPKLCVIGPKWYMNIENGEWVYHDEPIQKEMMNPSAAKKTRHGKNPIQILNATVETKNS